MSLISCTQCAFADHVKMVPNVDEGLIHDELSAEKCCKTYCGEVYRALCTGPLSSRRDAHEGLLQNTSDGAGSHCGDSIYGGHDSSSIAAKTRSWRWWKRANLPQRGDHNAHEPRSRPRWWRQAEAPHSSSSSRPRWWRQAKAPHSSSSVRRPRWWWQAEAHSVTRIS